MRFLILLLVCCFTLALRGQHKTDTSPFSYNRNLPLYPQIDSIRKANNIRIESITYNSPKGGRVTSYLVMPSRKGRYPAVVFQHWGPGNKSEFLTEAQGLASQGIVSLLIDAPWNCPGNTYTSLFFDAYAIYTQGVMNIIRGVDMLDSLPRIDTSRIAYVGHSYGAHLGGVLAGIEPRFKAIVLMAGPYSAVDMATNSTEPFWQKMRDSIPNKFKVWAAQMRPIDAEHYITKARVPVLHQYGTKDNAIDKGLAERYIALTPQPVEAKFYEAGHELNPQAMQDRDAWLISRLAPIPDSNKKP